MYAANMHHLITRFIQLYNNFMQNSEKKIDENGAYQSYVEISKSMLSKFEGLEGAKALKPTSS